jgi:hypothetical protein
MARTCAALIVLVMGCDTGGKVLVEQHDASADAPLDAPEPVTPIDAGPICNCNGGTGVCTDPVKDCPPANECCSFVCAMGPGEIKVCAGVAKDGGTP